MALDLTKAELETLIRDLVKKELNSQATQKLFKDNFDSNVKKENLLDEEEIRGLVREMLVNMFKTFWQRQNSWKSAV